MGKPALQTLPEQQSLIQELTLASFVTEDSWLLFKLLAANWEWMKMPVLQWESSEDYLEMASIVNNMLCTNDTAAIGVALMSDYSAILTTNETERQALLQVVDLDRKMKSGLNKPTLFL